VLYRQPASATPHVLSSTPHGIVLSVVGDVLVNSEAFVVTSSILRIVIPVFEDALRDKVCTRECAYVVSSVVLCNF
jgi:hypothetical protein